MIDRRELLAKARERALPLQMVEKDYVLGWVLYGVTQETKLVFKGGTSLAKVYFPETWRLSEDLDFVSPADGWDNAAASIPGALLTATERSGIELRVKSQHANPSYLQFKVRYAGPLGRDWLKIDVTPESPVDRVRSLSPSKTFSDYAGTSRCASRAWKRSCR